MSKNTQSLFEGFNQKTILITGHNGFKGSWMTAWLKKLGARVVGVSLQQATRPSHFEESKLSNGILDLCVDIRDKSALETVILDEQPDFVFHLAAQALVRYSYENPLETWETNVFGTLNLLEGLRKLKKHCSVVIITSDKCYDNVEWVWGYRETDSLGGPDPYSASKGAAELAIRSYVKSYFSTKTTNIRIASARAGNVIGGGDWSSDRIVPDCIKAWSKGKVVKLRNPHSTRPWQHVLEPLSGYLCLALALASKDKFHGEPFNFGPQAQQNHSVLDLVKSMSSSWDQVRWEDSSSEIFQPYESGLLKLNCDKALHHLNWHAVMDFENTVRMTAEWYRNYYQHKDQIFQTTDAQITEYTEIAKLHGLYWAQ